MPNVKYLCLYCDHSFQEYIPISYKPEKVSCPVCGDTKLQEIKDTDDKGDVYGYDNTTK